jgi:protein-tyrosine phosphatase
MNIYNRAIYNILCVTKNDTFLKVVNNIACIDDYNMIIPNLYLGNISYSNNIDFLKKYNIQSIVNCTEKEHFNEYFDNKNKFRLSINDSRNEENINKFKDEIINAIQFINNSIEENKPVYVHCYWGLMRSATVVVGYLMLKYNLPMNDAINIVKEQRPKALSSFYNFNDVLQYIEYEQNKCRK